VLPQVGPGATAALVLAAQAPALAALWRKPAPAAFCNAVVQARILRNDELCIVCMLWLQVYKYIQ
jgi:hypothetical protein